MQTIQRSAERWERSKSAAAFTFWFLRRGADLPIGAWMIVRASNLGTFLVAADDAPEVGETIELFYTDPRVEAPAYRRQPARPLPAIAQVRHISGAPGGTRRVTVEFA